MSISEINNNFYLSQSRRNLQSQSLGSFKATLNQEISEKFEDKNTIEDLVNKFSEQDLVYLATREPDKRLHDVSKNALKTLFVTIPLVDTIVQGALKGGNLSFKIRKSASTAGKWGGVFAVGLAVVGAKNLVNSNSKKLDNFDKNHSILSTMIDFTAFYTSFNMLRNFSVSLKEHAKNSFPKLHKKFKNVVAEPVKNVLNNSFINKKIVHQAEKFFVKRPYLNNVTKLASYFLVPAAIVSVLVRYNKEAKIRDEKVAGNYTALKLINDFIPGDE